MELIYYWINNHRCIHEQGFCFSPEYNISMDKSENGIYEVKMIMNIINKNLNAYIGNLLMVKIII